MKNHIRVFAFLFIILFLFILSTGCADNSGLSGYGGQGGSSGNSGNDSGGQGGGNNGGGGKPSGGDNGGQGSGLPSGGDNGGQGGNGNSGNPKGGGNSGGSSGNPNGGNGGNSGDQGNEPLAGGSGSGNTPDPSGISQPPYFDYRTAPSNGNQVTGDFSYTIRIVDSSLISSAVAQAMVELELYDKTYQAQVTGEDGATRFYFGSNYGNTKCKITVAAAGYYPFSDSCVIQPNTRTDITLKRDESAIIPTLPIAAAGNGDTGAGYSAPSATFIPTMPPTIMPTVNPTQALGSAFEKAQNDFQNTWKSNIAFSKPEQMRIDRTVSVELVLNPSLSKDALAGQVADFEELATSTSDPNKMIAPSGAVVAVETGAVEITPRMKAVLLSPDPQAFVINNLSESEEKIVYADKSTAWRWAVTAKKKGSQTLELVIYQMVKYDGKEFWEEVETYKANIMVEVTVSDRLKSLDWYWVGSAILIPLIGLVWGWFYNEKKKGKKRRRK